MCGACGTGRGLPRWEDRVEPATRRVLAARAAAANRLLDGGRIRVTAWGQGYQVSDGRGRTTLAADLDELGRTCGRGGARPARWEEPSAVEEAAVDPRVAADLSLISVWAAWLAHLAPPPAPVRLLLPHGADGALQVDVRPGAVEVSVRHRHSAVAVLTGPGARSAAEHLARHAHPAA